jgi:hypothetical protein
MEVVFMLANNRVQKPNYKLHILKIDTRQILIASFYRSTLHTYIASRLSSYQKLPQDTSPETTEVAATTLNYPTQWRRR